MENYIKQINKKKVNNNNNNNYKDRAILLITWTNKIKQTIHTNLVNYLLFNSLDNIRKIKMLISPKSKNK